MSWSWRYLDANGATVRGPAESFPTKSDAESWLGETWRELAQAGVAAVTLEESGQVEYGPMPLSAE